MFAEFVLESRPPPYYGELHESMRPQFINNDESYCEFVAEVIRQTHSRLLLLPREHAVAA